jgi:type IV secretion system protein VirB5
MASNERGSWKAREGIDTPYRKARQEWDLRMGSSTIQALNWRRATFGMMALVAVCLVGVCYLGAQPKAVPYVVRVDRLGMPTYMGSVQQLAHAIQASPDDYWYHLVRFIRDTRTLSADQAVVQQNWQDAYHLVTQSAANELNGYVREHNPFDRIGTERVSVDIIGVLPISKDTWQADWTETVWDENGNVTGRTVLRGTFHTLLRTPDTEQDRHANPMGLYIDEFHWSELRKLAEP